MDVQQKEVDANFEAFEKMLPAIMQTHAGKHALMKDCKVVEFFDTDLDAIRAGNKLFEDGVFSVQKVSREAVDLGFLSQILWPVSPEK